MLIVLYSVFSLLFTLPADSANSFLVQAPAALLIATSRSAYTCCIVSANQSYIAANAYTVQT